MRQCAPAGRAGAAPHLRPAFPSFPRPSRLAHDLPGQIQDLRVIVQDEVGVGGQHDPVQLEGEPVRVLAGRKLVLLERGDGETPDQATNSDCERGDPPP